MTGTTPDQPPQISFELFPPKTDKGMENLARNVDRMSAAGPEYFSVTYGAGGTTRDRTARVVEMVAGRSGLPVAHHLTCVGANRDEIDAQARGLWAAGVKKIVALRGDLPEGETVAEDGYRDSAELTAGLKKIADFDISVAAYPEVHPEAASAEADLDHLKRKFDAGADRAITQFAFDTDDVLRFVDRARAGGVDGQIVPGIMPVANFESLKRFAAGCGANIPDWMHEMFEGLDDTPDMRSMVATTVAVEQCRRFMENGLTQFHIYTLNKPDVSLAICRALGVPVRLSEADAA